MRLYLKITASVLSDCIVAKGKALVRAIEALGTIEPSGAIERAAARLLLYAYKRRLRGVVEAALVWMVEETAKTE